MAKDKYKIYEESFDDANGETNTYYDMVKGQKYDKLLDKVVQLENSRNQAMKQTQNQLNAQGFGSQGYGSSLQSGIYGRYQNALNQETRDYQNDIDALELERQQELKDTNEESYQQIVALMNSGAGNMNRVNEYLAEIGLGKYNSDTNEFTWGNKPENMSQGDWTQLKYLYNLQSDSYSDANANNYATYSSLEQLGNATYLKADGKTARIADNYKDEINTLWYYASAGSYSVGDTIKITNGQGEVIYLTWTPNGFRMSDLSVYDSAKNKFTLTRKGNSNEYKKVN